jgi:mannan endo-1,4-beta-mannosidase
MKNKIIFLTFVVFVFLFKFSFSQSISNKTFKTLDFLYRVSGFKTVAGIHNREPNAIPDQWTSEIFKLTGKYPGLWSGDFLFQEENIANRQKMVDEAAKQWNNGAIVNIMWHACNPALNEPCGWNKEGVLSHLSDEQWKELTTDGTALNKEWKSRVDEVCVYLAYLQEKGVEVLWRPMHEMNQGVFWWGGRPGPNGTRKLYQMLHDYMTNEKGLSNLIWVWNIQDFETLASDAVSYNPGDSYWDVLSLDVYDDKTGFSDEKYNIIVGASNGKPIAIGECQKLPIVEKLKSQPKWTFFMGWSELVFEKNSKEQIKAVYDTENVITLDEMPGWK